MTCVLRISELDRREELYGARLVKGQKDGFGSRSISPIRRSSEHWDCLAFGKEMWRSDLIGGCRENTANLFSAIPKARTRGIGHRIKYREFYQNVREHFTARMAEQCDGLPREIMEYLLIIFRTRLGMVLGSLLQLALHQQGSWIRRSLEVLATSTIL